MKALKEYLHASSPALAWCYWIGFRYSLYIVIIGFGKRFADRGFCGCCRGGLRLRPFFPREAVQQSGAGCSNE